MQYVSLHNHFDNDQFDGYQTIEEGVARAKELGMPALAITSHGTLSYTIPFYKECKKQGIKPIIGLEAYFTPDCTIKDRSQNYHLVLLAKNNTGYLNLKTLDTLSYRKETNFYYDPRIDLDLLRQYKDGLICLSACMGSILNTENGLYWTKQFKELFDNDFYLEIQANTMPEQEVYNKKILSLSRKLGIDVVVTTDAHYARKDDAKFHRLWVSLAGGEKGYYSVDDFYIQDEETIIKNLSYLSAEKIMTAITNTTKIAEQCNVSIEIEGQHLPEYPVVDKKATILEICRRNWKDKVPKGKYQEYAERFNYEIEILEKVRYLNYLLITWDVLNWCRQNNILTGIGRGSVGGSLVCYLLGIHKIDPIKHNLLFERFVNPYRVSMADIDNDVESARRSDVIGYIANKYGHVNKIRTFGRLGSEEKGTVGKGAVQRAGQALKIEPAEVDNISKQINESLDDILKIETKLPRQTVEELYELAKKFYGRFEKYGCHASAVLITPDNPINYVPIEAQNVQDEATGKKEWTYLASYDYHDLEEMGLLKLDVLGLVTLDVIKNTLSAIPDKIDIENLPLDDQNVYKLYSQGHTLGLFQVESSGMRQFAKKMNVNRFEDIVALVALYRPGPLDSGMAQQYIDGKNGAAIEYLHPDLEPILKDTFGVIVYQEQVMSIARKMAGYNIGEADNLRKIIGRKEIDKIDSAVNDFINRSIENGYSEEVTKEIGRQIKACGRYIFNRSHAVFYAYTSYITAYLKCYYPLQYFCALLNSKIDNQDKTIEYVEECKRLKIPILPPHIQKSKKEWTIEDNSLRYGLSCIKGIGDNIDLSDTSSFEVVCCNNNKKVLEALIKSGALDCFSIERQEMLKIVLKIPEQFDKLMTQIVQTEQKIEEIKTTLDKTSSVTKKYQQLQQQLNNRQKSLKRYKEKWQELEKLENEINNYNTQSEIEVLGFSFIQAPKIKQGICTRLFIKNDKRGKEMCFVDFDTQYGKFSCVIFASDWKKYKKILRENNEYLFIEENKIIKELKAK